MIFPEGLMSEKEFEIVAIELKKYKKDILLLANMTEFGKTPHIPLQKFEQLGYNCVIYPVSTLRIAVKAVGEFLDELKEKGDTKNQLIKMQTREELYKTLEYTPGVEWYFPNPTKKSD